MKTNVWKLATIFLAVLCLTFFGAALSSAKGPGSGGGSGGGGGGGGSPDLGDLIVLYRDAWGLPILTDDLCQQPLAAPGERFEIDGAECTPVSETDSCIIPVDTATCASITGTAFRAPLVAFSILSKHV